MKLISRDTWLAIIIVFILGILTVVAAFQKTADIEYPMLYSESASPDGGKALRLWLDDLGYEIINDFSGTFTIPEDVSAIFILQPLSGLFINEKEWEQIDAWVEEGGTLIIAGNNYGTNSAFQHYDFSKGNLEDTVTDQKPYQPILNSPPMEEPASGYTAAFLKTKRTDFYTLIAVEKGPLAVAFQKDQGLVILTTMVYPFTNAGLKETGNPDFILNIINTIDPDGVILFDEWHHGFRQIEKELVGPFDWLTSSPTGRAILFSAGVIFFSLILSGKHFGKPLPPKHEVTKRSSMEYISALANLHRRAGHRNYILSTYYKNIKREIGKRYRLDPDLEDAVYISKLSEFNPALNTAALHDLLIRLQQNDVDENTMVQLCKEAAEWLNPQKRTNQ